jgi:inner membrane transporter RhtA
VTHSFDRRAVGLVLLASTSLQLGVAIATTAFAEAGPLGATWIRSLVGAALLTAYIRPNFRSYTRTQVEAIVPYAIALAAMNVFVYLALDRAPLGVVSAILMLGPLTVAAWGQRQAFDLALVGVAASGALVLTLSRGVSGNIEALGLVFAVLGAVSFGAYIVLGKPVTKRVEGLGGLALALIIAAAIQTPLGLIFGEPGLWSLRVLGILAIAGVLSSLIPFAAEMTALRTLPIATFGLLLALEPAIAAIVGFLALGQDLSAAQVGGICLVVGAAAGSMGPRGWTRRFTKYDRDVMADPRVDALNSIPLFSGLSASDLATIAGVVEERDAETGGILTEQGEDGDEFYIVTEGSVEIQQDGRKIGAIGPGDHLGEIALIFGGPRTATAVVTEPCRLLVVGKDDFTAMLHAHPRIEDKILTTVMERMRYR